jgi:hypothetical protein
LGVTLARGIDARSAADSSARFSDSGKEGDVMADLIYVVVIVAFFGLAVLLVRACEHIIGPDDLAMTNGDGEDFRQ